MSLEKKVKHPLEGKYIVFEYITSDGDSEGSGLAVYKLERGRLHAIFNPAVYTPEELEGVVYDKSQRRDVTPTEKAIHLLKRKRVREVVSVSSSGNFFGIPYDYQFLDDTMDDEGFRTNWYEYKAVDRNSYEHLLLQDEGINVRFFDENKKNFRDSSG